MYLARLGLENSKSSNTSILCIVCAIRPDFFLLVDLREFFSDLGSGDEKK